MKKVKQDIVIQLPKKQLNLFGYEKYFNLFIKMFESKKLPNTIMLSGLKGSGKATFAYHFINFFRTNVTLFIFWMMHIRS